MTHSPPWLLEPALQELFAAAKAAGGEARAVGGAVRDHLLGRAVRDVDLATSLPPEKVMAIAQSHGWKAIPTGIAHGTVTLVLPNRMVEVTTLRRDIATDGRHATVAFTDDFKADASRRDFTFNALYLDAAGTLYDYFSGQEDLFAGRVRFIGDAALRIEEDGLRILRYFRFLARYGNMADAETLAAIAAHKPMLVQLSGERIAAEMHALLLTEQPGVALDAMAQLDLAPFLTHGKWHAERYKAVAALEQEHHAPRNGWVLLLALLSPSERLASAQWIAERWRLSRAERAELLYLAQPIEECSLPALKEWVRRDTRALAEARLTLALADAPNGEAAAYYQTLRHWPVAVFDVTARDLLQLGFEAGPALGETLRALEARWVTSDYSLSKKALLSSVAP